MLIKGFIHGFVVSILMYLAIYVGAIISVNELALQFIIYFLLYGPALLVGFLYRKTLNCSLLEKLLTNEGMRLYLYPIGAACLIGTLQFYLGFMAQFDSKMEFSVSALVSMYFISFVGYTLKLSFGILVGSWLRRST